MVLLLFYRPGRGDSGRDVGDLETGELDDGHRRRAVELRGEVVAELVVVDLGGRPSRGERRGVESAVGGIEADDQFRCGARREALPSQVDGQGARVLAPADPQFADRHTL